MKGRDKSSRGVRQGAGTVGTGSLPLSDRHQLVMLNSLITISGVLDELSIASFIQVLSLSPSIFQSHKHILRN